MKLENLIEKGFSAGYTQSFNDLKAEVMPKISDYNLRKQVQCKNISFHSSKGLPKNLIKRHVWVNRVGRF